MGKISRRTFILGGAGAATITGTGLAWPRIAGADTLPLKYPFTLGVASGTRRRTASCCGRAWRRRR